MKNDLFLLENENFQVVQNTTGYHPGQVLPSRADEAPLGSALSNIKQSQRPIELAYQVSFNLNLTAATVCRKFATCPIIPIDNINFFIGWWCQIEITPQRKIAIGITSL